MNTQFALLSKRYQNMQVTKKTAKCKLLGVFVIMQIRQHDLSERVYIYNLYL